MLKGKLTRDEESLEDLLTSNVFGTMKYVPFSEGLIHFIHSVEDSQGEYPFKDIDEIRTIDFDFWPSLTELGCSRCEPDVLVRLITNEGRRLIFLIESKYLSGKSSEAEESILPKDQLAKEWDNLIPIAKREKYDPFLIYVTAHTMFPKDDIESSIREQETKRSRRMSVAWISWRKLTRILEQSHNAMIQDLACVLKKLGLVFFEGFIAGIDTDWDWDFDLKELPVKSFIWEYESEISDWRYNRHAWQIEWPQFREVLDTRWEYRNEQ